MTTVFVIGGSRHPGAMESVFITVRRSPWKRDTGIFENTLGFFCIPLLLFLFSSIFDSPGV